MGSSVSRDKLKECIEGDPGSHLGSLAKTPIDSTFVGTVILIQPDT